MKNIYLLKHAFNYDSDNQLTVSTGPVNLDSYSHELFTFDAIGNRVTDHFGNYVYDESKQILQEDWQNIYLHDPRGNLISKQKKGAIGQEFTNYFYNTQNQLIGFEAYENNVLVKSAEYFYDALGRRIEKVVENHTGQPSVQVRRYVYDSSEILLEYDADNRLLAQYTQSTLRTDDTLAVDVTSAGRDAGVVSSSAGIGTYYFTKDALGSIREVIYQSGNLVSRYIYSTFGVLVKVLSSSGSVLSNPDLKPFFTFTNRELDTESGLYQFRARMYSPLLGRFLQVDPNPGNINDPLGHINKYIFPINNPVNFTDPEGLGIFDWGDGWDIGIARGSFSEKHAQDVVKIGLIAFAIYMSGGAYVGYAALFGAGVGYYSAKQAPGDPNLFAVSWRGAFNSAAIAATAYLIADVTTFYFGGGMTDADSLALLGGLAGGVGGSLHNYYLTQDKTDSNGLYGGFLVGFSVGAGVGYSKASRSEQFKASMGDHGAPGKLLHFRYKFLPSLLPGIL